MKTAVDQGTAARTAPNFVWEAYEKPRGAGPHLRTWEDGWREATWDDWRRGAERVAVGLRELGVGPGTRVAGVLTNTFDVCATVLGTWLAGGVVVSLPTMRRGMSAVDYVAQLRRLCRDVDARVLLLEDRFVEMLGSEDLGAPVRSYGEVAKDGRIEPSPPADDELAFVQYSSGSTNDPKGCMLSMGAISEQERMLADRLQVDESNRGYMWLPLSHDMGLFGCVLLSWTAGLRLAVSNGERFLRRPQTWFDDCADFQANLTVTPNFGLALAARKARTTPPKGSFPMQAVILGGERIEWATLEAAHEVLGPFGVTRDTLTPAYGLAEGTLAVTMKPHGATPHRLAFDGDGIYRGELTPRDPGAPGARDYVACGVPMRNVSVRTVGDDEEGIGRICLRSTALADGYLNDPEATEERFVDGELVTEDLGFVRDGELYVIGRTDDVIPFGGRNLFARDVEVAVAACDGVRPGCAALVDLPDPDSPEPRLVLLTEAAGEVPDLGALADEVASIAFHAGGARVDECVFVQRGELPKTPSGKIQRFRCRAMLADGGSALVERVEL